MSDRGLLEFPCRFPIKAMGRDEAGFDELVRDIIAAHVSDEHLHDLSVRPSRGERFISVTVTITASSQEQLDDIYRALTAHERVLMAL